MKLKKFISLALSVLMVVMLFAVSVPVLASPATTVSIGNATVAPGQTAVVTITIQTDQQFGSATIRLEYNQSIVQVNSVSAGDLGTLETNIDNANGRTTMAAAYGSVPGKTGTVKFTDVTVQAVGNPASSSPLTLTVIDMWNSDVNPVIPEAVSSGTFSIAQVKYTLTTAADPVAGGTVGVNPAQPQGGYDAGTVVTLTATANANYIFSSWSGDLTGNTNPTTITMNSNKSVTANFGPVKYTLTLNANPAAGGTVGANPAQPQGGYDPGTVVTLTATANANYTFSSWSGDLTGNTNPTTITMNSNKSVTANFDAVKYTLTTAANPVAGGTVGVNPAQPQGGYDAGTVVTLTATANANYTFSSWSGDLTGNTNPTTITMNSNKSVTANFGAVKYTLTTANNPAAGGTVGANPVQPPEGYDPGTVVTLTATANANYTFDSWSGDLTGNTNPTTITMNSNKSVTANYIYAGPKYTLVVNSNPTTGGTVNLNPSPPADGYAAGTAVTLTAVPNPGYNFVNWSGDLTGNTSPATLTMDANKNVTANFARAPFTSSLKAGWNILSTPIALSMNNNTLDKILDVNQLQIAYRWDASVQPQRWVQVTIADQLKPLEAFYVKVSADTPASFVAYEGISPQPFRSLYAGLNLIGPAPALDQGTFPEMPLNRALITIEQAAGGLRGYSIVCSPPLNQPGWVFIIGDANIPTLIPYKGYWVVMENPDTLFGFSTTPIP